ncbi:hypothetical protein FOXG_19789 [Fusarium oxysporum f. sp. lycopersici 4287]|uniref:Uncharacterized protein n=2 Tax=Fusarium oxysporum TaxID=5507 RepID=A0A0J9WNA6_FUSO4|nr:hypothetical protein FOXG_19789 [Fusarium oxysporum f. sp. lycopersici 4287]EXK31800.1 hypothetical protein FOMG_12230 [Fusarium oxysporum f. sp. melonis 26406]KNB06947.1 hypothetical protein FOXG_19789 [Fusarium oxysporum f. sp. lycopersici 4287]
MKCEGRACHDFLICTFKADWVQVEFVAVSSSCKPRSQTSGIKGLRLTTPESNMESQGHLKFC